MLELRPPCENCNKRLPHDSAEAMICTFECNPPRREERDMSKIVNLTTLGLLLLMCGCAPEVGSDAWCEAKVEKDKGDWTTNEASEFAGNCIFKNYDTD